MKLGIDFGTTRIVRRGCRSRHYPLISFEKRRRYFSNGFPTRRPARRRRLRRMRAPLRLGGVEPARRPGWTRGAIAQSAIWKTRVLKRGSKPTASACASRICSRNSWSRYANPCHVFRRNRAARSHGGGAGKRQQQSAIPHGRSLPPRGILVLGVLNEPSAASIEFGIASASPGAS